MPRGFVRASITPQREEAPDPARPVRATTLTNCGQDAPLPGGLALGGFDRKATSLAHDAERHFSKFTATTPGKTAR
jgi:hypothetical protein